MERKNIIVILLALLISACVGANDTRPDEAERGRLSTKMVNLSSAVDTYFSFLPKAPGESDSMILQSATSHDPRLMAPDFEPYEIKVQYQNPYAILLLCSKEGDRAIIEDAGCSARIDRQITAPAPCEFTLNVTRGCQVQGADSVIHQ